MERVGRNAAIDRARVEQRRAELAPDIEPPPAPADPESALLVRERRGLVRRALASLPRPQRRAALLRFHGELPFQIVAARLGTQEVTARTRVQRALDSLRARLGSLRAFFVIPGAQAAVLGVTVVVATLPAAPSPLAIARRTIRRAPPIARGPARPPGRRAAGAVAKETAPREERRDDITTYSAVQRINFEDEHVLGDVKGPEARSSHRRAPATHSSLIEIRQHFVPEMVKSLEETIVGRSISVPSWSLMMHAPRDPDFERRVRASYARQAAMATLGATLVRVAPGDVVIELPFRAELTQQHGFLHAGIVTSVMDSACGYAAMSLMEPGAAVLSVEFKVNLLAPARGDSVSRERARGARGEESDRRLGRAARRRGRR